MKHLTSLLLFILISLSSVVAQNTFFRTNYRTNADSVGYTNTGTLRYDNVTGKYWFWNSVTGIWFSPAIGSFWKTSGITNLTGFSSARVLSTDTNVSTEITWSQDTAFTDLVINGTSTAVGDIGSNSIYFDPRNYNSLGKGLVFRTTGNNQIIIRGEDPTFPGAIYNADYSANYTDRSLIDRGYALSTFGVTASKGLTKVGNDIQLGGTITSGDVNINTTGLDTDLNFQRGAVNVFGVTGAPASGFFGVKSSGGYLEALTAGSLKFIDNRATKVGLEYSQDYTATLGTRSLIDRGFADANYWKTSGTTTVADGTIIKAPLIGNLNIISNGDGFDLGAINIISSQDGVGESARMTFNGVAIKIAGQALQYETDFSITNPLQLIHKGYADATYLPKSIIGFATLDFPSTTATTVSRLTITVTGAADADPVSVGVPINAVTATGTYTAWVSAVNTVTVQFSPKATEDPAPATFKVIVHKL